jgi:hypothetical protein
MENPGYFKISNIRTTNWYTIYNKWEHHSCMRKKRVTYEGIHLLFVGLIFGVFSDLM